MTPQHPARALLLVVTVVIALAAACAPSPPGTINPFVGTGTGGAGGNGDGGPALHAVFDAVRHVVVDGAGNTFISDAGAGRVRKVSPSGVVTTVAGGGSVAPVDAGTAIEARFPGLDALAVDGAGDLYFAGYAEQPKIIWKVGADGILTAVAGVDCSQVPARPACSTRGRGDGGPASDASFLAIYDLALAGDGSVLVADFDRLRRVGPDGIITTVAGGGDDGSGADGVPARDARFSYVLAVIDDRRGGILFGTTDIV